MPFTVRCLRATYAAGVHILLECCMNHLVIRTVPWSYKIPAQYGI